MIGTTKPPTWPCPKCGAACTYHPHPEASYFTCPACGPISIAEFAFLRRAARLGHPKAWRPSVRLWHVSVERTGMAEREAEEERLRNTPGTAEYRALVEGLGQARLPLEGSR